MFEISRDRYIRTTEIERWIERKSERKEKKEAYVELIPRSIKLLNVPVKEET